MNSSSFGPWNSLVNDTSPFVISIYASINNHRLYGVSGFFVVVLLLPVSAQTLMLTAFAIFCLLWIYAYFSPGSSESHSRILLSSLVISSDGYCCFDRGPMLKLTISSRIGFAGCWLILTDELFDMVDEQSRDKPVATKSVINTYFIFKNSVSAQDYARLSRVVLSLKQHQTRESGLKYQALN